MAALGAPALVTHAQKAPRFSLTVTPPLFQVSLSPGEVWSSGLTVVNTNPYDITVYARVAAFEAAGEGGQVRFRTLSEEARPFSLAGWITLSEGPIVIPKGGTKSIPLVITVPKDAAPGGHYAAILVGNDAEGDTLRGTSLSVSSSVASLVFLRVAGEVVEKGVIREFSVARLLYQEPRVDFSLRFQNVGNVHLQPQGNVAIYDMWGTLRGNIPINQKTDFGNVLPGTTRKFTFTWRGRDGEFLFGRFRAIATLAYGARARENISRETVFWIIPLAVLAKALMIAAALLAIVGYLLRWYIRRALQAVAAHGAGESEVPATAHSSLHPSPSRRVTPAPLHNKRGEKDARRTSGFTVAVAPLRRHARAVAADRGDKVPPPGFFTRKLALFFLLLAVLLVATAWYFSSR